MQTNYMRDTGIVFMGVGFVLAGASLIYAILSTFLVFFTHWFSAETLEGLRQIAGPQWAMVIAAIIIGLFGVAFYELSER